MSGKILCFWIICLAPVFSHAGEVDSATRAYVSNELARLKENEIAAVQFSSRWKAKFAVDKNSVDFNLNLRIKRDSAMWMSFTGAMGVEGARMLLTRDSTRYMNRQANEYSLQSLKELSSNFLFPVTYEMLQEIILGSYIRVPDAVADTAHRDTLRMIYLENNLMQEIIYYHPINYTITRIVLKDKMILQELELNFDAHNPVNGKPFSHQRTIEVRRGNLVLFVVLDLLRISTDQPLSFPFDIPDKYQRTDGASTDKK